MTQDPNNPNNPGNPEDEEFLEEEFGDFADFPDPADHPDFAMSDDGAGDMPMDELDENFSDEQWEEEEASDESAAPAKKGGLKGLSFNTIVIGVAVIVGLGVLAYQVMSTPSGSGTPGSRFQSALNFTGSNDGPVLGQGEVPPVTDAVQDPAAIPQGNDSGFLNNPESLDGAPAEQSPPMPTPMSNETDDQGTQQADGALTPMPATTPPASADIQFDEAEQQHVPRAPDAQEVTSAVDSATTSSPAMDVIRNAQMQQEQNAATPPVEENTVEEAVANAPASQQEEQTPVETSSAPASSSAMPNEQLTQLIDKLDAVSARLDSMEKQIAQNNESAQTKFASLEKDIGALKQAAVREAAAPAQKTKSETVEPREEAEPVKAAPKKDTSASAAPKKQAVKKEPAATKNTDTPVRWELRAAQPGRAWVSRKGEQDIQSVQIGDKLAGLGQISRIELVGGRWVVSATGGEIRQ